MSRGKPHCLNQDLQSVCRSERSDLRHVRCYLGLHVGGRYARYDIRTSTQVIYAFFFRAFTYSNIVLPTSESPHAKVTEIEKRCNFCVFFCSEYIEVCDLIQVQYGVLKFDPMHIKSPS